MPARRSETGHAGAGNEHLGLYVKENVGLCSTYSTRTRSGPQRNTAYVFAASTTSSISTPRSFAAAMCSSAESTRTARWLSSGLSGAPGSPGWNSTYAPPTSTRGAPDGPDSAWPEAERAVLRGGLLRIHGEERDVIEVVVDVGRGLDEPEAHTFRPLDVRLTVARTVDLEIGGSSANAASRSATRNATWSSAPRSLGPSASNSVILPRRAFDPSSVKRSVRSMTCMPRCAVTKSAIASRSATQ